MNTNCEGANIEIQSSHGCESICGNNEFDSVVTCDDSISISENRCNRDSYDGEWGEYSSSGRNVDGLIVIGGKEKCGKKKYAFELIKEDFKTKTSSTKSARVYEKRVPKKKKNVEILFEKEQPKCRDVTYQTVCQPVCNDYKAERQSYSVCQPASQQSQVKIISGPACENTQAVCKEYSSVQTACQPAYAESRRNQSCEITSNTTDERYVIHPSEKWVGRDGSIYIKINGENRGECQRSNRRPVNKIFVIEDCIQNECGQVETIQKQCCAAPVVEEQRYQEFECRCTPVKDCRVTCTPTPVKTARKKRRCCYCLRKFKHKRRSQSCP